MIVTFLDFDGCLNSHNSFMYRRLLNKDPRYFVSGANPMSVALLDYFLFITGSKIVVSSSWRHGSVEDIQNTLREEFGLVRVNRVIGQTPRFNTQVVRGVEIEHWLKNNKVDNYIILDDESDMLEHQMNHLIQTDMKHGFGVDEFHKAIDFLGFKEQELAIHHNDEFIDKFRAGEDNAGADFY